MTFSLFARFFSYGVIRCICLFCLLCLGFADIVVDKTLLTTNTTSSPIHSGSIITYHVDISSVGSYYDDITFVDHYDPSYFLFGGIQGVRRAFGCPSIATDQPIPFDNFFHDAPYFTGLIGQLGTGCSIRLTITGTLIDGTLSGVVLNTGYVLGTIDTNQSGQIFSSYYDSESFSLLPHLAIDLTKRALQTGASLGDTITFRLDFGNIGNVPLRFDILDIWPSQLDFVGADLSVGTLGPNGLCNGSVVYTGEYSAVESRVARFKNNLPVLQPGEYGCALLVGTVNAASFSCLSNTATVQYEDANQNAPLYQGKYSVTSTDAICSNVSLRVEKNSLGLPPVHPGDPVAFEILITNSGSAPASNVWILDTFPSQVIANATLQTSFFPVGGQQPLVPQSFVNSLLWSGSVMVPTIAPQSTLRLVITGFLNTTSSAVGTTMINTVCVRPSPDAVSSEVCDDATVSVEPLADLWVTKTLTNQPQALSGFDALFSLTIGNSGFVTVTGIRLDDTLSEHLVYVSHTLPSSVFSGQSYNSTTRTLTMTGITLAPGQQYTFDLLAQVKSGYVSGNVFGNTATIRMPLGREGRESTTIFDMPSNNISLVTGTLATFSLYDLLISPGSQYAVSGSQVTVTMEITGGSAGNVLLVTPIPSGFSIVSSLTTAGYTVDSLNRISRFFSPSSFAGGNPIVTLVLTPTSAQAITTPKAITGSLFYSAFPYNGIGGPQVIKSVTILPRTDLTLVSFLSGSGPQLSGDTVTTCFSVFNNGGVAVSDARVYLPASLLTHDVDFHEYRLDNGPWTTWTKVTSLVTVPSHAPLHVSDYVNSSPLVKVGSDFSLMPGQSRNVCIRGLVGNHPLGYPFTLNPAVVTDTVEFTGSYSAGLWAGSNGDLTGNISPLSWTMLGIPDVYVTKLLTSSFPRVSGDMVSFTLVVGNSGSQAISGFVVRDIFPSFISYGTSSSAFLDPLVSSSVVTWTGGELLPGSSVTIDVDFVMNNNYQENTCFSNTGQIILLNNQSVLERTNTLNNQSGSRVCALGSPDLWVSKQILQGQSVVQSGDIVLYQISFGNSGTAFVSGFMLADYFFALDPNGSPLAGSPLTGLSFSLVGSGQGLQTYLWRFGTGWTGQTQGYHHTIFSGGIAPGQQYSLIMSGRLASGYAVGSQIVNTLSGTCLSINGGICEIFDWLDNNTDEVISIVGGAPDLVITKSHGGFLVSSGDIVSYEIIVGNNGTQDFTGSSFMVTDILPSSLAYVSGTSLVTRNGITLSVVPVVSNSSIQRSIPGPLMMTDTVVVAFDARLRSQLSGGTILTNTGTVTQLPLEYSISNNTSTDVIEVGDVPGVSIIKTLAQSLSGVMGQEMAWHLDIYNNARAGSGVATGVVIRDILPPGFIGGTPLCTWSGTVGTPGCMYDPSLGQVITSGFDVDGGSSVRLTIRGRLDYQPTTGLCITNTGFIDLTNDLSLIDNISSVTTCIPSPISLAVTKTAHPAWLGSINPASGLDILNSSVGFVITLTNNGLIPLTLSSVTDLLMTQGGFVWNAGTVYPSLATNIVLGTGQSQSYFMTGTITNRNFTLLTNQVSALISGSLFPLIASITVNEPPAMCGDLILSRGEQCEMLAGGGVLLADGLSMYEGQVCRACQIVTERVINCAEICHEGFCTRSCDDAVITQPDPHLAISKTVVCHAGGCLQSGQFAQNDTVRYTVTITNTGSVTATNILVTDARPAGLQFLSYASPSIPGFMINSGSSPFQGGINSLPPGQSVSFDLIGRISSASQSTILNTACVQTNGSPVCANASLCANCGPIQPPLNQPGLLAITKTVTPSTVSSGDMPVFDIIVTNTSSSSVPSISLTDVWPNDVLDFVSWRILSGSVTSGPTSGLSLFTSLPFSLAPSASLRVQLQGRVRVNQSLVRVNTGRISYLSGGITQINEAVAPFTILPFGQTCQSLSPRINTINILPGQSQSLSYVCTAAPGVLNPRIRFNCGLGGSDIVSDSTSLSTTCTFSTAGTYTPRCYVNDQTANMCGANVVVTNQIFGVCGNGIVNAGEKCDLGGIGTIGSAGWLDTNQTVRDLSMVGRTCNSECDLIGSSGDPVVPAQLCNYTDVPLSVMPGEILPLWRDLGYDDSSAVSSCSSAGSDGKIIRGSLRCTMRIYHQGREPLSYEQQIVTDCTRDNRGTSPLFSLFSQNRLYSPTVNYADGKTYVQLGDENAIRDYGEYKMSLDRIEYDYCDNGTQRATSTARVCQVNFAITPPYFIQQNITSMKTDALLGEFWNMDGTRTLSGVSLANVQRTNASLVRPTQTLRTRLDDLIKKYTEPSVLASIRLGGQTISKVRGKNIYIVPANSTYREVSGIQGPLTVIAQGDLTIDGDIAQSTMIISLGRISFVKDDCTRQFINGMIVAFGGFDPDSNPRRNTDLSKPRCIDGGVTVEGVMIGDNLDDLVKSKRSQLNMWFSMQGTKSINQQRADLIYQGGAVSIRYNPSLWRNLPPIANEIGKELEKFR